MKKLENRDFGRKLIVGSAILGPPQDVDKERADMGQWIADYLDDAGFV